MIKRLRNLLLTALILTASVTNVCYRAAPCAVAEDITCPWARVVKDEVNIYANENCDRIICLLEKSYYVEIVETLDTTFYVTFMQNVSGFSKISGYVRKSEVQTCDVAPLTPYYPTVKITVTADSAQIRFLPLVSSESVVTATNSQALYYYGKINYYGKKWYYVSCAGVFGYVDSANVSAPIISLHPTPLEIPQPVINPSDPSDTVDEPDTNGNTPTAEILLIVFVVLLAVGLTLALFLPGNVKKQNVFEQDI
ncbi:MAG: hypothetical protein NC099_04305 [Corallococcus sp.]|nr:hypothetical protein [Corallococcus sp.]